MAQMKVTMGLEQVVKATGGLAVPARRSQLLKKLSNFED